MVHIYITIDPYNFPPSLLVLYRNENYLMKVEKCIFCFLNIYFVRHPLNTTFNTHHVKNTRKCYLLSLIAELS